MQDASEMPLSFRNVSIVQAVFGAIVERRPEVSTISICFSAAAAAALSARLNHPSRFVSGASTPRNLFIRPSLLGRCGATALNAAPVLVATQSDLS